MASARKICPTCGVEYPETERFCPKDGMALHSQGGGGADLVGSVIAERYHVLKQLGAGGMGRVYLAEHVKMGRQCAIKVLHPSMARNAEAIARFNREAANASRIDHPNVAAIYDFGETPDGLLYLAMQYIEGEALTTLLTSKGALPPLRACDITRQAAEGLYAAHAMGIVHRDLKPDNVMVSTDPDGLDNVKVVDFGIAKSSAGDGSRGVTKSGIVVGTPEYMSPEQLAGDDVDARSDLYSLALVAFHMLTGQLPFPEASTRTAVAQRLTERPRSLAEVRPDIAWPDEVQAVMDRALQRDPDLRHVSTREFARALHMAVAMMPMRDTGTHGTRRVDVAPPEVAVKIAGPAARRVRTTRTMARERRQTLLVAGALGVPIVVAIALGGRPVIQRARASSALEQGISAFDAGHAETAREHFVSASTNAPDDPMPHVYLARLSRQANDLGAANEEAVKAVRLAPDNGVALHELATTLYALQNFSGARAFYARAIKANPADRVSQGYLGCTLIRLGRSDEGMRWLQRAGSGTWSACAAGPSSIAANQR